MLPRIIRNKALKSYLQMNCSPSTQIAIKELAIIAVAELLARSTRSAKGRTTVIVLLGIIFDLLKWIALPIARIQTPDIHLQEKKLL